MLNIIFFLNATFCVHPNLNFFIYLAANLIRKIAPDLSLPALQYRRHYPRCSTDGKPLEYCSGSCSRYYLCSKSKLLKIVVPIFICTKNSFLYKNDMEEYRLITEVPQIKIYYSLFSFIHYVQRYLSVFMLLIMRLAAHERCASILYFFLGVGVGPKELAYQLWVDSPISSSRCPRLYGQASLA